MGRVGRWVAALVRVALMPLGVVLASVGLAAAPVRDFFALELLTAGQWFLALISVATGLVTASALWRLPFIQRLEEPVPEEGAIAPDGSSLPGPTHAIVRRVREFAERRRGH